MNLDFFNYRRTVRGYSKREVSDDLLRAMLEASFHAPTTGNMQLYSVVVTRSAEGKKALAPAHFNQPSVEGCNVLLTFCADFNRFVKWCDINNAHHGYNNFQSFITALLDTTIVAQQFCTIAEMNGLGCCYLGTTTYNAPDIAKALNLPSLVVPVITLSIGYAAGSTQMSDRLPIDGLIHNETYQDYTDEAIKALYAEKEGLAESRRFVAENNKENLAQVFTDVRYTKQNNEYFSKVYRDFIESQGYKFED